MSVFRGVILYPSDYVPEDGDRCIDAILRHGKQDFNPDHHVNTLHCSNCGFTWNNKGEIVRINDHVTGNTYYVEHDYSREIW